MVRLWLPQVSGKNVEYLGNKVHRSQTSCSTWPGCGRGGQQTRDIGGRTEQTCVILVLYSVLSIMYFVQVEEQNKLV